MKSIRRAYANKSGGPQGEIVGLFGLVGAGRSELMKGMFGGTQITAGQVYIDQQPIDIRKPSRHCRRHDALPGRSQSGRHYSRAPVRDNINISARRKHVLGGCVINNGWEENNADHHIRSLNIKTPGAEQLIMNLSGGNQKKPFWAVGYRRDEGHFAG